MGDILIYILIYFVVFWLVGIPLCILSDKKSYNNGICSHCGKELRYFDTDSQGARGYCCDGCNNFIWISWPVDRKRG